MKTLWWGIPVVLGGFALMFWHLRQWTHQQQLRLTERERAFFGRQFKRRALIGSLIAMVGAVLASLQWVSDPLMFAWTVLLLLALLLVIVCIALADMFYGVLHVQSGREAQEARQALIREYLSARERQASATNERSPPPDSAGPPSSGSA